MLRIVLTILIINFISSVYGYPITPQTLRKQIENSKYIVIASIDNPDNEGKEYKTYVSDIGDTITTRLRSLWGDGTADLRILKVLKGDIKDNSIIVNYPSSMTNPRPPQYPDQKKIIAFLSDSDTSSNYKTVGLSYGTILFDLNESTDKFETLINEYIPISRIKNKKKKKTLTASWLVKCCEDRSTRWHGAYELNRYRHWRSHYDYSEDNDYAKYLSEAERNALAQIVLSNDTISYNELCLSDFVMKQDEAALKSILIFNLKFFRILFVEDLMKRYLEIDDRPELEVIYDEYKLLDTSNKDNKNKAMALSKKFIELVEKD